MWNPHGGAIRKFVTYCGSPNVVARAAESAPLATHSVVEPSGVCGAMALTTEEYPVETGYANVAPHLGIVWIATGGTWKLNRDGNRLKGQRGLRVSLSGRAIPNYYPGSPTAVDYLTDRNLRAWVQDYVSEHGLDGATSAIRAAFDYLFAHFDATFNFTQGIQVTFEVTFHDGSSVVLQQSLNQPAEFKPGSARDSTGQALPKAIRPTMPAAGRTTRPRRRTRVDNSSNCSAATTSR